jgi:corrinoid protein of di/trimethylamine methyltransferase
MSKEEALANLQASVETGDISLARESARRALDEGVPPFDAINLGLAKGMKTISSRFDEGKIFLPQIIVAAKAMDAALEIIEPCMEHGDADLNGVIIMGSVRGDIHEIGKNVCCAMLRGAGYRVIDLGCDVPADEFVNAAKANNASIVGGSALMTTSLYQQKDIVRVIRESGLHVLTIFGGAPCTDEWVKEIGGDGYSSSGAEIVDLVKTLYSERSLQPFLLDADLRIILLYAIIVIIRDCRFLITVMASAQPS